MLIDNWFECNKNIWNCTHWVLPAVVFIVLTFFAGNTLESLKQAISVHKSLARIEGENIHLVSVHSPHYKIDPGRIKGILITWLPVVLCRLRIYRVIFVEIIFTIGCFVWIMNHVGLDKPITEAVAYLALPLLCWILSTHRPLWPMWTSKCKVKWPPISLINNRMKNKSF